MIIDKLSNITKYTQFSPDIIDFILKLSEDIPCQKYLINEFDYANVETYNTKSHENCFFETHRKYADIQILLSGKERLDYSDVDKLTLKTPYDNNKDIAFFENSYPKTCSVTLDGSNFVVFFPNEAHRPQMNFSDQSQKVKKVVVKIKM